MSSNAFINPYPYSLKPPHVIYHFLPTFAELINPCNRCKIANCYNHLLSQPPLSFHFIPLYDPIHNHSYCCAVYTNQPSLFCFAGASATTANLASPSIYVRKSRSCDTLELLREKIYLYKCKSISFLPFFL